MNRAALSGLFAMSLCISTARAESIALVATDAFGTERTNPAGDTDPMSFEVRRVDPSSGPLSVTLMLTGTATETTDFAPLSRTLSFATGQTTRVVQVVPLADWTAEPGAPETVIVTVAASSAYDLAPEHNVTLGIADADSGGDGLEEREIDVEPHVIQLATPGGRSLADDGTYFTFNPNGTTEFTLYLPRIKGALPDVVRAVVVGLPGSGGRDYYDGYDVFLAEHGLAYLSLTEAAVEDTQARTREEGIDFFDDDPYATSLDPALTQPILDALDAFAASLARPELHHAPLLLYGHSRGALTAHLLAAHAPGRVIGFVANHWGAPIAHPSAELLGVPALFFAAEYDHNFSANGARYWEIGRAAGGLWGWAIGWGMNHNFQGAERLEALEFFDAILPLRYGFEAGVSGHDPRLGPVALAPLVESAGFLGERIFETFRNPWAVSATEQTEAPNWYRDFETQNPFTAPFAEFDRDERRRHPWYPSARVANLFATRVSQGSLSVRFSSPDFATRRGLFIAGRPIRARLDVGGFPEATRVEFLANGEVAGNVTTLVGTGASRHADFTYTFETEGMVRLSARAIAADGATRLAGDHGTTGALVATIRPAVRSGNHAPAVSVIDNQRAAAGASLSLPFTVTDPDTLADNLSVSAVSHLGAIATDVHIEGTGANRTLSIALANNAEGEGDVLVFASDGDLVATEYVQVTVAQAPGSTAPAMELYVRPEWEITPANVFTRPMTMHLIDPDTAPESLMLATGASSPLIRAQDRVLRGYYDVRALVTRKLAGDRATQGFSVSDGADTTRFTYDHDDGLPLTDAPPVISDVPDLYVPAGGLDARASFRVADLETPEALLAVSVTSSDEDRLPASAVTLAHLGVAGIDRDRMLVAVPSAAGPFDATLSLTVRDEAGLTATTRFVVHVGQTTPTMPMVPPSTARARGCSVGAIDASGDRSASTGFGGWAALVGLAGFAFSRRRQRAQPQPPRRHLPRAASSSVLAPRAR